MIALLLLACGNGHRIEKADEALREGDLTTAESYYREVLDRDPDFDGDGDVEVAARRVSPAMSTTRRS